MECLLRFEYVDSTNGESRVDDGIGLVCCNGKIFNSWVCVGLVEGDSIGSWHTGSSTIHEAA